MNKENLPIIIAGPTASGKTGAALALAKISGGEIISVDSRQVYKFINAGTAAPKGEWQGGFYKVDGIKYHLVDFLDLNEVFDVSRFCRASEDITSGRTGTQFIFAGGTGMYMQGYFSGMDKLPEGAPAIRAELAALAEEKGREYLHKMLASFDEASASAIPAGNIHRVIRAIELYRLTGKPASVLRTGKYKAEFPKEKVLAFYMDWDRDELEKRIISRTEAIFEPMAEEAQAVLKMGYKRDCPGLKSLGYREALEYIDGKIGKREALEKIIILTRQYAKRQRTWFRRYDDIIRIKCSSDKSEADIAKEILLWKERRL